MADLKRIIFDFILAINYSFLLFLHNTLTTKCSIKIKKLPIILQLKFFCKCAIEKIVEIMNFIALGMPQS